MKRVAVLGSTGSIGRATLQVIQHLTTDFSIFGLAGKNNLHLLAAQAVKFKVKIVVVPDLEAKFKLKKILARTNIKILVGEPGLIQLASHKNVSVVVMAMSGTLGLKPLLYAIEKRKQIALSTKELLVGFGEIIMAQAKKYAVKILPIDSELAGLHQCLDHRDVRHIKKVIITASGGPFFKHKNLKNIKVKDALKHPVWKMGSKITIDSATLANKGLEVIETARLFSLPAHKIDVLIHPQCVIHALIEFNDNSVIAQLARPDMRACIQYALTYPERLPSLIQPLDLTDYKKLEFFKPDLDKFPALKLAYQSLRMGGLAPCAYNTVNEIAVNNFLHGNIEFYLIPDIISQVLCGTPKTKNPSLDRLLNFEKTIMTKAEKIINNRKGI